MDLNRNVIDSADRLLEGYDVAERTDATGTPGEQLRAAGRVLELSREFENAVQQRDGKPLGFHLSRRAVQLVRDQSNDGVTGDDAAAAAEGRLQGEEWSRQQLRQRGIDAPPASTATTATASTLAGNESDDERAAREGREQGARWAKQQRVARGIE